MEEWPISSIIHSASPRNQRVQYANVPLNHASVVIIAGSVYTGAVTSNLIVFEIDGVIDTIQQLNDTIMQLVNHTVLDEGDKTIAWNDYIVLPR